jgi:hypothetical protein
MVLKLVLIEVRLLDCLMFGRCDCCGCAFDRHVARFDWGWDGVRWCGGRGTEGEKRYFGTFLCNPGDDGSFAGNAVVV